MGQSQAYKRRHPGRQGQISAQEYTGLTFRWITAVRIEGRRQQGQAAGSKVSQDRPGHTAARARTASTGTVRQARHRAQGRQAAGRHSKPGTHATHSRQSHTARRASEAAEGRGEPGARRQGAQGQRAALLNMRHTETSNCAIVLAWQESERGRARQGASRPTSSQRETVERLSLLFCLQTPTRAGHPASAARLRYYPGPIRPAARGRPGSSPDMNKNFFPISLRLPQNPPGRRQKPWEII